MSEHSQDCICHLCLEPKMSQQDEPRAREFDLYFVMESDGMIDPYSSSICENYEIWKPGNGWAEPNAHVIEHAAYLQLEAELKEQCRINGIGAQRELKLETELNQARNEIEIIESALVNLRLYFLHKDHPGQNLINETLRKINSKWT